MRTPKISKAKALRVAVVASVIAAGTLTMVATSSQAAVPALKLSVATGPGVTAGTVITVTGTGFKSGTTKLVDTLANHGAQFQTATTCAQATPDGAANIDATYLSVVSSTSVVVKTPSLPLGTAGAAKDYYLCLYKADDTVLGQAKYTVYGKPTVTGIDIHSGPVFGGQTMTITGTGFSAKSTAKVGSVAMTGLKVVSATSITAVVPAQSAGAKEVKVTTEGGTSDVAASSAGEFTYTNAITVSPATAPAAGGDTILVTGVGFDALDFTDTAKVLFVQGTYDPTDDNGEKTVGESGVCEDVTPLSDTQLICNTPDGSAGDGSDDALLDGAYTVTVVSDDSVGADLTATDAFQSVVSSDATFTAADF